MDRRVLTAIAAIIILGGLFFVVQSQSKHHTARHLTFRLQAHAASLTPDTITAVQGDSVTLRVTSDSTFELHLHGYNRKLQLQPGKTAVVTFVAGIAGAFEMENEGQSRHLGTLTVNPG